MPFPTASGKGGFTLIELLAAIAIVSILVAILIPALAGIKRASNQAKCISNQRQVYNGLLNYDTDNGELPPLADVVNGNYSKPFWNQLILPYMGITIDPRDPQDPFYRRNGGLGELPAFFMDPLAPNHNKARGDFGVIFHESNGPIRTGVARSYSLKELTFPSRVPLVITAQQLNASGQPIGTYYVRSQRSPDSNPSKQRPASWHNGNTFVVFADGSTQMMTVTAFYTDYMPFTNEHP